MKTLRPMILSLMGLAILASCSEDDLPKGDVESTAPVASFTATPSSVNPNYIVLDNTSQGEGVFSAWRFKASGSFVRDEPGLDTVYFAEAGTYKITLLAGNDAGFDSTSTDVVIAQRDADLPDPNADAYLLLGDFENGEVGSWNAWGQDVSVIDNPESSAVNSSSKVLKVGQSGAFETAARNETPTVNGATATKISVDVYFDVAGSLKLQIELPFETGYFIDVPAGEWTTIEYVFEDLGGLDANGEYPIVMFQGNAAGNYYLDNIKYYAIDIVAGGGDLLADFEDGQVGPWNAWGQDVSVADNPKPNAVNGSEKALKMVQSEPWTTNAVQNVSLINANSKKMQIDAYFEVAGSLKFQIEQDFGTGYFLDVPAGEWVTLEYNLEGEYKEGEEYSWIVIQGNTSGTYYIDNITYYE